MNYTGDVLNFGVAIEKMKAERPGAKIEMLVVGDDVGVTRSSAGKVGRRGIAGTILVTKVAGAMAERGYGASEIIRVGRVVKDNLVSLGASLERVHVPGSTVVTNGSAGCQVELGMGIHNETGSERMSSSDAEIGLLVEKMLEQLLGENDKDRNFLSSSSDKMIMMLNNLGATSPLELTAIVNIVGRVLRERYGKTVVRIYCGTFMTSLDGPGFSISLLNVTDLGLSEDMLQLLDDPANVSGWSTMSWATGTSNDHQETIDSSIDITTISASALACTLKCDVELLQKTVSCGLRALIESEAEVTMYDNIVGDGDCGTTLKRGAEEILDSFSRNPPVTIDDLISQVTSAVEASMDGTSGALYSIFLNALSSYFKQRLFEAVEVDLSFCALALQYALEVLTRYTTATVGDRTMMDALIPFVWTLSATGHLQEAASAAAEGAEKTKGLLPKLGCTVYVGSQDEWLGTVPDPGAWGLSKFLSGLVRTSS